LNRNQVIATEEQVEVCDLHFAGSGDMYGLYDDKEVSSSFLGLGALIPVPAIFNV